ncbi:hypothetical protein BDV09DRAFT_202133 [Aspergillus tetrazonus]
MVRVSSPSNPRPTIIILHGAIDSKTLSMNGARPPNSGLYTDSDHIRSYAESLADAGHRLVVLMHSYGGQVATNALAGLDITTRKRLNLPGGVIRLVYLCAHALTKDSSMFGIAKAAGCEQFLRDAFNFADDGTVEYRDFGERMVGPDLSKKDLESYIARLKPWNGQALYQEIREVAWMDIPVSYILTQQDRMLPIAYQDAMVAGIRAAGREIETFELDTGHCAHATMTAEVVEILHTVASREIKEQ